MQSAICKEQLQSTDLYLEMVICKHHPVNFHAIGKLQTANCKQQTQIIKLQSAIHNIETVVYTMQSAMCYLQYTVRDGELQVITLGHKKEVAIPPLYAHCWYEDFQLLVARQFHIGFLIQFQIQFQIWFQIHVHIKYQMTYKQKYANWNLQSAICIERGWVCSNLSGSLEGGCLFSIGYCGLWNVSASESQPILYFVPNSVLYSIPDWGSDSNIF